MKKIEIYEQAMCCSTGLCGPKIDQELLRISTLINSLAKKGIIIERYNLSSAPEKFVENNEISKQLAMNGPDILPITLVDEVIVKTQTYPTNEELSKWTGIAIESVAAKKSGSGCCGGNESCC